MIRLSPSISHQCELAQPRWLTEKEVHAQTGISLSTLRKHRHKMMGIPYSKVGRSVRYASRDVVSYMEAHRIVPQS